MTGAFLPGLVDIAFEHQGRDAPNVDLWDHAPKLHVYGQRTFKTDDFRSRASQGGGWMAPILSPEDVVRRIAAECTFVDDRGAVGIRLKPAAAIGRQYGNQFRALRRRRRPRPPKPAPLL